MVWLMPNWKRGITSSFLGYSWALFMSILWDSGGPLFGDLKGFKKVCFKSVFSPPPLYQMVAISEATSGCSHPGDHTGLTLQQVYLLLTTGLHLNLVSSVVFIFYISIEMSSFSSEGCFRLTIILWFISSLIPFLPCVFANISQSYYLLLLPK